MSEAPPDMKCEQENAAPDEVQNTGNPKQLASAVSEFNPESLSDMLPLYYKRLFPHMHIYRWLSYGNYRDVFSHREISFTLHNDIYVRYLSFDSQVEMEKEICARNPHKIDIGAVMNKRPKHRTSSTNLQPQERELVFDIDMTDYDNVRTCCEGTKVCNKCWKFMALAARILDAALRDDFGFEHILWVFSGRRGIHCWVCDAKARQLDARGRSAVAEYLQIVTSINISGENTNRVQLLGERIHHSIRRALRFVEPMFNDIILDDQNLFGTPKGIAKLLSAIPDDTARKDFETYLQSTHEAGVHSRAIWDSFVRYANAYGNSGGANANIWNRKLKHIIQQIQLTVLYPRLDINVTKGFNHLLKAPFCIHPSTGKICVPFNANTAGKFDPTTVPTISELLQEINVFDDKTKSCQDSDDEKSRIKDYKKTGMFKGVVIFEEFLRKLERSLKSKTMEF